MHSPFKSAKVKTKGYCLLPLWRVKRDKEAWPWATTVYTGLLGSWAAQRPHQISQSLCAGFLGRHLHAWNVLALQLWAFNSTCMWCRYVRLQTCTRQRIIISPTRNFCIIARYKPVTFAIPIYDDHYRLKPPNDREAMASLASTSLTPKSQGFNEYDYS